MKNKSEDFAPMPLTMASPGNFRCTRISLDERDAHRIQRLGICIGRPVVVLATGDPMIVLVSGARIGVSRQLAEHVMVVAA